MQSYTNSDAAAAVYMGPHNYSYSMAVANSWGWTDAVGAVGSGSGSWQGSDDSSWWTAQENNQLSAPADGEGTNTFSGNNA